MGNVSEKEKMLAGELYDPSDRELSERSFLYLSDKNRVRTAGE